ncbi:MAG: hypothetical protein AB7S26_08355 [Sandaracinaceae bacterium]
MDGLDRVPSTLPEPGASGERLIACAVGSQLYVDRSVNWIWAYCRPARDVHTRVAGYADIGFTGGGGDDWTGNGLLLGQFGTGIRVPVHECVYATFGLTAAFGSPTSVAPSGPSRFFAGEVGVGLGPRADGWGFDVGLVGGLGLDAHTASVEQDGATRSIPIEGTGVVGYGGASFMPTHVSTGFRFGARFVLGGNDRGGWLSGAILVGWLL